MILDRNLSYIKISISLIYLKDSEADRIICVP